MKNGHPKNPALRAWFNSSYPRGPRTLKLSTFASGPTSPQYKNPFLGSTEIR